MELHHRKQNRLQDYDYSQNGAYFITICTKKRHEILCNIVDSRDTENNNMRYTGNETSRDAGTSSPTIRFTEYGKMVETALKSIRLNDVTLSVDAYVIMPDHVHFVLIIAPIVGADVPGGPQNDIPQIPRKRQMQIVPRVVTWFKRFTNKSAGFDMWQRSYHDHVIRNAEEYRAICQYIADNPARWLHR